MRPTLTDEREIVMIDTHYQGGVDVSMCAVVIAMHPHTLDLNHEKSNGNRRQCIYEKPERLG